MIKARVCVCVYEHVSGREQNWVDLSAASNAELGYVQIKQCDCLIDWQTQIDRQIDRLANCPMWWCEVGAIRHKLNVPALE